MKIGPRAVVYLLALVILSSCSNKLKTREAVERGVRDGVVKRGLNIDAMDVTVTKVDFHGNEAEAVVAFTPKGGRLSDGLTWRYTLQQQNDHWVIVKGSQAGSAPHGSTAPSDGNALPAGHPPLDGQSK